MQRSSARSLPFFVIAFVACLASLPLHAQFSSAVEGTVMDAQKAVIPNVTMTLRNVDTGIGTSTTSSSTGYYRFPSLPAATFTLSAASAGFKTTELAAFPVQIGETKTLNLTLEIGQHSF